MRDHRADSRGIRAYGLDGFVLECTCGNARYGLSATRDGAAEAWYQHVIDDARREADSALRHHRAGNTSAA